MRVFNLTDVSTPALTQNKMVGVAIAVGVRVIGPGESTVVPPDYEPRVRRGIGPMITLGALAIDSLPAAYIVAKDAMPQNAPQAPAPVPAPAPPVPPRSLKTGKRRK